MRCFNPSQIHQVSGIFSSAEKLTGQYFRLSLEELKSRLYDVKTLAQLQTHELADRAFAHLCRYGLKQGKKAEMPKNLDFYSICLQDHRILDAVDRGRSFVRFEALMLYIAVHELTHVIRFSSGHSNFDASPAEKDREEEKVNFFTKNILGTLSDPGLRLVHGSGRGASVSCRQP